MATYRGIDGSVTWGGATVAEVTGWEADIERDMFENSQLGEEGKTYSAQQYDITARITANFDYSDTAGQKAITDLLIGTDPTAATVQLLHESGKYITYSGLPSNASIGAQKGQDQSVTFTVRPTGAVSITWA